MSHLSINNTQFNKTLDNNNQTKTVKDDLVPLFKKLTLKTPYNPFDPLLSQIREKIYADAEYFLTLPYHQITPREYRDLSTAALSSVLLESHRYKNDTILKIQDQTRKVLPDALCSSLEKLTKASPEALSIDLITLSGREFKLDTSFHLRPVGLRVLEGVKEKNVHHECAYNLCKIITDTTTIDSEILKSAILQIPNFLWSYITRYALTTPSAQAIEQIFQKLVPMDKNTTLNCMPLYNEKSPIEFKTFARIREEAQTNPFIVYYADNNITNNPFQITELFRIAISTAKNQKNFSFNTCYGKALLHLQAADSTKITFNEKKVSRTCFIQYLNKIYENPETLLSLPNDTFSETQYYFLCRAALAQIAFEKDLCTSKVATQIHKRVLNIIGENGLYTSFEEIAQASPSDLMFEFVVGMTKDGKMYNTSNLFNLRPVALRLLTGLTEKVHATGVFCDVISKQKTIDPQILSAVIKQFPDFLWKSITKYQHSFPQGTKESLMEVFQDLLKTNGDHIPSLYNEYLAPQFRDFNAMLKEALKNPFIIFYVDQDISKNASQMSLLVQNAITGASQTTGFSFESPFGKALLDFKQFYTTT